jgi:hypothetical protein
MVYLELVDYVPPETSAPAPRPRREEEEEPEPVEEPAAESV